MPHHIKKGLLADPAMPEHVGLIAGHLIEACLVASDLGGGDLKEELCALDVLLRKEVPLTVQSMALVAVAYALRGDAAPSDAAGLQALRESRRDLKPAVRCDAICALARTWTIHERWDQACVDTLRQTYQLMHDWGDEPRKARVGVWLIRFLIESGDLEGARRVLLESRDIAGRLNLAVVDNDLIAAGGRLYLAEGRYDKALRALRSACGHQERSKHWLRLAENSLPLAEAALLMNDAENYRRCQETFDWLLPRAPGLALPHAASRVRSLCRAGAVDEARREVTDLRDLAREWSMHVWAMALADRLEAAIARSAAEGSPAQ
jgi:hypothetical protein